MNHHAEKLIYASPGEPGYNLSLDGAVEESHTCPGCGAAASRRQVT
jgi:transcription initiation factor IIE alpha subunit